MKRTLHTIRLWIMIAVLALSSLYIAPIASSASSFDVNAESAILVDFETGDVLFAKNADTSLPPASMTKMMTEYLVLEAIKMVRLLGRLKRKLVNMLTVFQLIIVSLELDCA